MELSVIDCSRWRAAGGGLSAALASVEMAFCECVCAADWEIKSESLRLGCQVDSGGVLGFRWAAVCSAILLLRVFGKFASGKGVFIRPERFFPPQLLQLLSAEMNKFAAGLSVRKVTLRQRARTSLTLG